MDLTGLNSNLLLQIVKFKNSFPPSPDLPLSSNITDKTVKNKYGETEVRQYRNKQKILSNKERKEIVERYKAGESTYQLTKAFGCHRSSVSNTLKKAGVTPQHHRVDDADVVRLYESGQTSGEIAKKYNTSATVILRTLHKNGAQIRNNRN